MSIMYLSKFKFFVNMTLVIATTYIIIWYIFTPSNNQCQMTFMMEPPKFIPVSIDDADKDLAYSQIDNQGALHRKIDNNKYKLFMYSEFGFPSASNVRRDLKDSMPVLFVPGNAGSYQQVRSLASTCIRRQLQSLNAFKFIFYTIDFDGQLSGISGQLIEEQTRFVHQSLRQVAKVHPTETNGVILIGHSVGGFISKALFGLPNFDPKSVPLLISLASPLTQPYLVFDDKMRELYDKTNEFWEANRSRYDDTIAISISGGKPDRLVPMHLSMDPQFDLSLTTSSIKDIWLPTDHVCITWCRELMQKMAHLLSALMDKKQTQLIKNKEVAMSIIRDELLISDKTMENSNVILKDWKSMRPHTLVNFQEFYSASRSQLGDSIVILNITANDSRFVHIWIDHIESLKSNGVFGCRTLTISDTNSQINCTHRIDLMHLAIPIPSRRFEPKRTTLKLDNGDSYQDNVNYIVFDFVNHIQGFADRNTIPESLIVQKQHNLNDKFLYIPTLFEFAIKRLFFVNSYSYKVASINDMPLIYVKFKLYNLKQKTQIFSIKYESNNCHSSEQPNGATILFSGGGYLSESFHSSPSSYSKGTLSMTVKIASYEESVTNEQENLIGDRTYLEFYIDGTCENSIKLEVDLLDLAVSAIQRSLGTILTSLTFLVYLTIITNAFNLEDIEGNSRSGLALFMLQIIGISVIVYLDNKQALTREDGIKIGWEHWSEELTSTLLIFILSQGGIAYIDYFMKRIVDLAIITNNAQSLLKQKVSKVKTSNDGIASNGSLNGAGNQKSLSADFDWLLIGIAIAGSILLSPAIISLFTLFILIKLGLSINIKRNRQINRSTGCCSPSNKHCIKENESGPDYSSLYDLVTSIASLCVLALLANIPSALIRINSSRLGSFYSAPDNIYKDLSFLSSTLALLLVKMICERVGQDYNLDGSSKTTDGISENGQQDPTPTGHLFKRFIELLISKYVHSITIVPIMFIEKNMCNINLVLLSLALWLNFHLRLAKQNLPRVENGFKRKKT